MDKLLSFYHQAKFENKGNNTAVWMYRNWTTLKYCPTLEIMFIYYIHLGFLHPLEERGEILIIFVLHQRKFVNL